MNWEVIKSGVEQVVALCESVPERFRDRCFDLLMGALLREKGSPRSLSPSDEDEREEPPNKDGGELKLNAPTRAFMKRHGVAEEQLSQVVMTDGDEVHFVRKPKISNNATGQIDWALLLALKSGLADGKFEVSAQAIRATCDSEGCYDRSNFAKTLKRNKELFKAEMSGDAPQGLSNAGEARLAALIKTLSQDD
jgi:hypothetical protein